jgi:glutathione S-transferase
VSYRLYDYLPSGNGYKVRLVLRQLGLPYELVELDIKRGETRTPGFLAKNPNGRIPLLEIPGHGYLAESHAIISYLAEGSVLVPADRLVGGRYSLADIALYAYAHVAPEGGFSLEPYPAVRAWCARVAAQPGHVPITSR